MSFRRGETDRIREPRTVGVPMVNGYLVLRDPLGFLSELPSGELVPTTDPSAATHIHVVDPATEEYAVATIEEAAGLEQPVMIVEGGIIDIYAPDDPRADARSYLEPTALPTEATHVHALDAATGDYVPMPIAEAAGLQHPRELVAGQSYIIY